MIDMREILQEIVTLQKYFKPETPRTKQLVKRLLAVPGARLDTDKLLCQGDAFVIEATVQYLSQEG